MKAEKYNVVIHNHPSDNLIPSQADLRIASLLVNQGIGFYIINNQCSEINIIVKPVLIRKISNLQWHEILCLFNGNSQNSLQNIIPDFKIREGQVKMAEVICIAFNQNEVAVIEAGTGIGKSFAYLIPGIFWTRTNKQRIIISTFTIPLQQQLLYKDLKLLENIVPGVKAEIAKGRQNYLCLLKYNEIKKNEDNEGILELFDFTDSEIKDLLHWAENTQNGQLEDIPFLPSSDIWDLFKSDSYYCVGKRCCFFTECYFMKARRLLSEADIIIANHHLLLADIEIRYAGVGFFENAILPPYQKVIIDEAHNLEKACRSFFANNFSQLGLQKILAKLLNSKGNKGILIAHFRFWNLIKDEKIKNSLQSLLTEQIIPLIKSIYKNSKNVFAEIIFSLQNDFSHFNEPFQKEWQNKTKLIRICESDFSNDLFLQKIIEPFSLLFNDLFELEKELNVYAKTIDNLFSENDKKKYHYTLSLFYAYYRSIIHIRKNMVKLLNPDFEKIVLWIEVFSLKNKNYIRFKSSLLNYAEILRESLYSTFDTVILTSATLSVNNEFSFIARRFGLSKLIIEPAYYQFHSPFDYKNNVLLTIPNDIPEPNESGYSLSINEEITKLIQVCGGGALILFTSYKQLSETHTYVSQYKNSEPEYNWKSILLLKQGEMNRSRLLDEFRQNTKSCLFATESFWEGVDIPGDSLKILILTRLPFKLPTDPFEAAVIENMEKKGENSFFDYSLPLTILKFRQGFGRLIRKENDRGIVVVLDVRINNRQYGSLFLKSLPACKINISTSAEILKCIKKWWFI